MAYFWNGEKIKIAEFRLQIDDAKFKPAKVKVIYELTLKRFSNRDILKTIELKTLHPRYKSKVFRGLYQVRYRVTLKQGRKVIARSEWSPFVRFSVR
ncbi:MAG: hypothetical protein ACOX2O_04745 [Bdellovibrionota bacterium]